EDLALTTETFDLVISSLSIHYVEDYSAMIHKIHSLLKNNGEFIFSTEHPIATARKGSNHWIKTEDDRKLHWALDNYQEEGIREHDWYVDGVVIYHRTIST